MWASWALGLPAGAVLWAEQRVDRPPLPYLSLERISGPTARGLADVRRRWPAPASAALTLLLPAVGDAVRFRVDGWIVSHVRGPGEAIADVRDALIGQCAADSHLAGWSATPAGPDGIVITPAALGDFARVDALRSCVAEVTPAWSRRVTLDLTARVRVAAMGARSQSPTEWIAGLRLAMEDDETRARLARYGLAFRSRAVEVDPRDVEAPPEVEEVAALDLFLAWQGQRTTPLGAPLAGAWISGGSILGGPGEEPAATGLPASTDGKP